MKSNIKRALEIVEEIEENNSACCAISTEPDMVEIWCFELKEILKELDE
tara:strand:- start:58 stop:204 length:147 start_codon:yes stop_codon:yes gene_type:complete